MIIMIIQICGDGFLRKEEKGGYSENSYYVVLNLKFAKDSLPNVGVEEFKLAITRDEYEDISKQIKDQNGAASIELELSDLELKVTKD